MVTRFVAALAALALLIGLAACTSSGNGSTPSSTGASTPSTTAVSSGKTTAKSSVPTIPSQHALPNPSSIKNSVTLRRQVVITKCVSTSKGWQASGSAVNTSKTKNLNVRITVFFTTTKATVLDYAQTRVDIEPGKTGTWTAAADFDAEKTMRCVLRGVG